MKEVATKFPERLIELRTQNNMTRQELADVLGISRASLEYYEKGQRTPDINMLYRLSEEFAISADYMLGRTKKTGKTSNINEASKYTGLSVQTINKLHEHKEQAEKKAETAKNDSELTSILADIEHDHTLPYGTYRNIFKLPKRNSDKVYLDMLNDLISNDDSDFAAVLSCMDMCVMNYGLVDIPPEIAETNRRTINWSLSRLSDNLLTVLRKLSDRRNKRR